VTGSCVNLAKGGLWQLVEKLGLQAELACSPGGGRVPLPRDQTAFFILPNPTKEFGGAEVDRLLLGFPAICCNDETRLGMATATEHIQDVHPFCFPKTPAKSCIQICWHYPGHTLTERTKQSVRNKSLPQCLLRALTPAMIPRSKPELRTGALTTVSRN